MEPSTASHAALHISPWLYADVGMIVSVKTLFHVCYREEMIPLGDGDIRTMCPLLSMRPGEYSYFSPRTMSMWAGPEHWRFRPRHKRMYFRQYLLGKEMV